MAAAEPGRPGPTPGAATTRCMPRGCRGRDVSRRDGPALLVTVYRRVEGGEPAPIATLSPDGTGRIEYVDREVAPGSRYGYRLGARQGDLELRSREVWVDVPEAPRLALEPIHPNPL